MNLSAVVNSSIGKKIITGLTGLILFGFVIGHLIGNLLLLAGPEMFNDYAYFLESLGHGMAIYVAEAFLLAVLFSHVWSTLSVQFNKARHESYTVSGDAGGRSKKSLASMSMAVTGLLLLTFIVVHIAQFKFNVFGGQMEEFTYNGHHMKNLYGLVVGCFGKSYNAILYMLVMGLLGTHLSHGVWSAFQSLGLANDSYLPILRKFGFTAAFILALGFLALPAIIWVGNDYFVHQSQTYMTLVTGGH